MGRVGASRRQHPWWGRTQSSEEQPLSFLKKKKKIKERHPSQIIFKRKSNWLLCAEKLVATIPPGPAHPTQEALASSVNWIKGHHLGKRWSPK